MLAAVLATVQPNVYLEILTAVSLVGGAIVIIVSRKGIADDNEAVKTATLMTGQIAALSSARELDAAEMRNQKAELDHMRKQHADEISQLRDKMAEKERAFELLQLSTSADITRLEGLITQQAAVDQFRADSFKWFEAIAVAVKADPPFFPDHVST